MFAERDALVRAGRTARFSRAQVGARAVWRRAGVQSLPTAENGQGEWISVDEGIRPMILDLIGDIAPVVAASINRHFIPVAEMAYDEWPEPPPVPTGVIGKRPPYGSVRTGLSKSKLALEIDVASDGYNITASLINTYPGSLFIRRGATVRELIWRPGRDAADPMAAEIVKEIGR